MFQMELTHGLFAQQEPGLLVDQAVNRLPEGRAGVAVVQAEDVAEQVVGTDAVGQVVDAVLVSAGRVRLLVPGHAPVGQPLQELHPDIDLLLRPAAAHLHHGPLLRLEVGPALRSEEGLHPSPNVDRELFLFQRDRRQPLDR